MRRFNPHQCRGTAPNTSKRSKALRLFMHRAYVLAERERAAHRETASARAFQQDLREAAREQHSQRGCREACLSGDQCRGIPCLSSDGSGGGRQRGRTKRAALPTRLQVSALPAEFPRSSKRATPPRGCKRACFSVDSEARRSCWRAAPPTRLSEQPQHEAASERVFGITRMSSTPTRRQARVLSDRISPQLLVSIAQTRLQGSVRFGTIPTKVHEGGHPPRLRVSVLVGRIMPWHSKAP